MRFAILAVLPIRPFVAVTRAPSTNSIAIASILEKRLATPILVDDEIKRWHIYAYGCSRGACVQPDTKWLSQGPFTKLWLKFLKSNITLTYKITTVADTSSIHLSM
ncbi:hypothetical protein BJ742DRAFT_768507 [Cladochytrium replicatum]|nr:hypothetical protein BJ742DRAFT_768507 [Cladochytrium replicatum]